MAFVWGWLSDGPFRGARYPFIYFGCVLTVRFKYLHSPRLLADNFCNAAYFHGSYATNAAI